MTGTLLRMAVWRLLPNGRTVSLYTVGNKGRRKRADYSTDLGTLFAMLERGEIAPEVADRMLLEEAPEAHCRIEARGLAGKLVLLGSEGSSPDAVDV
jgi:NADPH:quinone reductase-like Zn-dependent oxidoreductase